MISQIVVQRVVKNQNPDNTNEVVVKLASVMSKTDACLQLKAVVKFQKFQFQ